MSEKETNEAGPEVPETETPNTSIVPRSIGDLMVRPDALQVLERQVRILQSLRRASIAMTFPEDWLLFRAEDPRNQQVSQYGYLQDKGCQRIRDLWGIDTRNVGPQDEKGLVGLRVDAGDGSFSIVMIGDGYCYKTGQTVERIEGGRSSQDDAVTKFIQSEQRAGRQVSQAQLDLTVRKNARANLEGNIVRRLTGMSGITIEELADVWKGTNKDVGQCILGRGYGQGQKPAARENAKPNGAPAAGDYSQDVPPVCDTCSSKSNTAVEFRLVAAGTSRKTHKSFPAFWACPNHQKCGAKTINAKEWHDDPRSKPQSEAPVEQPGEGEERIPF